jgi:hypothetical protein
VALTQVSGQQSISENTAKLVVKNGVGDVTVLAEDVDVVRVEAKVKIKESRAAETPPGDFADHVTVSVDDGALTVANAHLDQADKEDWSVDLVIRAPPNLAVRVDTGVGDIKVTGTQTDVQLAVGVGDITVMAPAAEDVLATAGVGDVDLTVETARGRVKAESGTGDVALAVTAAPPVRKVKLTTGVGDVTLKIPQGSSGTFACETGVGSVMVTGHEGINTSKSGTSAKAKGTIGQDGPDYELETGVGNVVIE